MISGKVILRNYNNWRVYYFLVSTPKGADKILDRLAYLRCSEKFMRKAEKLLISGPLNTGLTYSKPNQKETVLVVSKTTSLFEFLNSFAHEIDHVEKHIAKRLKFSPYSEDASYLVGELVQAIFFNIFRVC